MSYISDRKKALSEEKSTSAKDTNELEHELAAAKSLEAYFEANVAELREETLAEHLARLLAEKHLEKADVIARSGLAELYAYHIFAGRKPHPSKPKVLALAQAESPCARAGDAAHAQGGATPALLCGRDAALCPESLGQRRRLCARPSHERRRCEPFARQSRAGTVAWLKAGMILLLVILKKQLQRICFSDRLYDLRE